MDSWGKPNPSDRQYPVSPTETLHFPTAQRRSTHRQQQSETQFPFISTPSPPHTLPPPAFVPNKPAIWQLGQHSQYISGAVYDQQLSTLSRQPILGYLDGDGGGGGSWGTVRVQRQVNELEGEGVHHVEEELHRRLKARQISMIALGGTIGIGLVIGTGTALRQGGPLGLLLGYSFVGCICYCLMQSIGEMATYLPHKKGFAGYTSRFWHPAFGFALGWNYVFYVVAVAPNLINATGIVIQLWDTEGKFPKPAWMSIIIIFILCINLLGVRVYGELEFWFSTIKVITLMGLIIFGIIVDLGGSPQGDRIGFRYWRQPGPMGKYLEDTVGEGPLATFLGFWSVMVNALYAYNGIELIGVTVGEAENPRRNVPKAIRRTFFRITFFYIGGVFVIGLLVPSDAPVFVGGEAVHGVAASPFVYIAKVLGIRGLVHVINASMLVFIVSTANTVMYISSRTVYGLALLNQAPKIFRKVTKWGVPVWALLFCWLFSFLVFMNLGEGLQGVFIHLVNVTVTFSGITWMCIVYTHIRFMRGLAARGISRNDLPYKAAFQPWASWFALVSISVIMFFKGFATFIHGKNEKFKGREFVSAYIGIPIFFLFAAFWRWKEGCHTVSYAEMDLLSGTREIDEEEKVYLEAQQLLGPQPKWKRIWDAL